MSLLRRYIREVCGVQSDDIDDALATAQMAHLGQKRRSGESYISHPMAVADLVHGYYPNDQVLCGAALLHDSLEDAIKLGNVRDAKELMSMIVASFGDPDAGHDALRIIQALTHDKGIPYDEYVLGLSTDPSALRIKLADMLHNLRSSPSDRQADKYRNAIQALIDNSGGHRPGTISSQHWSALLKAAGMRLQKEVTLRQFIIESIDSDPVRMSIDLEIPTDLHGIHGMFKDANKELYVVGGAVRDTLLNKMPKDYDLATDADPETVINILEQDPSLKVDLTGKSFGVVRVWTPDGNEYELATFRRDIGSGRRPDAVEFTSIEDDVKRRDLTINALFYDMDSGEVVDYVGGIEDIKDNVIKAVGDPATRFHEDKLRILRAARFAGRLGSDLDRETRNAIIDDNDLTEVSPERIRDEFVKGIVSTKSIQHFLRTLDDLDLFSQLYPGLIVVPATKSESRDPIVQLALMLYENDVTDVKRVLRAMKYTNGEIDGASFLLEFLDIDKSNAPEMKKEFKRIKLSPRVLDEFHQAMNFSPKKVEAFLAFTNRPPSASPKDLMAQGLRGPEIGVAMHDAEGEAYETLLGELREYIKEMLCEHDVHEVHDQFYTRGPSSIHGIGTICTKPISHGHIIGLGFIKPDTKSGILGNFHQTLLGRFLNHSPENNLEIYKACNLYYLRATKDVQPGEELTVDYRDKYSPVKGNPTIEWDHKALNSKKYTLLINGIQANVDIANSVLSRQEGLMHRNDLADNDGMLFIFSEPDIRSFWMKDTYVPLSIAFADDDGVIINIEDMHPYEEVSTLSIAPATYALEMNRGWFKKNGIEPGHKIEVE